MQARRARPATVIQVRCDGGGGGGRDGERILRNRGGVVVKLSTTRGRRNRERSALMRPLNGVVARASRDYWNCFSQLETSVFPVKTNQAMHLIG